MTTTRDILSKKDSAPIQFQFFELLKKKQEKANNSPSYHCAAINKKLNFLWTTKFLNWPNARKCEVSIFVQFQFFQDILGEERKFGNKKEAFDICGSQ